MKRVKIYKYAGYACCFLLGILINRCFLVRKRPEIDKGIENAVCFEYRADSTSMAKSIILVPISHIGTSEYASELKNKLDSLRREGYCMFSERVYHTSNYSDTTRYYTYNEARENIFRDADPDLDTVIFRKIRRIMRVEIEWEDSLRARNRSMSKADRDMKYTHISYKMLGIGNSDLDYWIDYTGRDLIDLTEQKFGEIILTEYDYNTPLGKGLSYNPPVTVQDINQYKKERKREKNILQAYVYDFRDEYLYRKIKNAPFDKIAVIYGGAHIRTLEKWMAEDPHFEKVEHFHL